MQPIDQAVFQESAPGKRPWAQRTTKAATLLVIWALVLFQVGELQAATLIQEGPPRKSGENNSLGGGSNRRTPDDRPPPPPSSRRPEGAPPSPAPGSRSPGSSGPEIPDRLNPEGAQSLGLQTQQWPVWEQWWRHHQWTYLPWPRFGESHQERDVVETALANARAEAFEIFAEAAQHPASEVRFAAMQSLAFLGDARAIDVLTEGLKDPDLDVSELALLALGMVKDELGAHSLLHLVSETSRAQQLLKGPMSNEAKGMALWALSETQVAPAIRILLHRYSESIRHPSSIQDQVDSTLSIRHIETVQALEGLVHQAGSSQTSPWVRQAALISLAANTSPAPLALGVSMLADKDARISLAAIDLVSRIVPKDDGIVIDRLFENMRRSPLDTLRQEALIGFGEIGGPEVSSRLARLVPRHRPGDRQALALALGLALRDQDQKAFARYLVESLEGSGSEDERSALALALGLSQRPNYASAALRRTLADSRSAKVAAHAAIGLALLGDTQSVELLVKKLQDRKNPVFQKSALWALGFLDHPVSLVMINQSLLKDPRPEVRREAAFALGLSGKLDAVARLREALTSRRLQDSQTQAAIIKSLGFLLRWEPLPRCLRLLDDFHTLSPHPTYRRLEGLLTR